MADPNGIPIISDDRRGAAPPAAPFLSDHLLRVQLPSALHALQSLRDASVPLSDETTMAAWNGIVFCHEQIEDQTESIVVCMNAMDARRALISSLENLAASLESGLNTRLASAERIPRLYRLAKELKFTEKEIRAFVFMVLWSDERHHRSITKARERRGLVKLCSTFSNMNWAEFYTFADPEREHMKQGLIAARTEESTAFIWRRVPPAVVKALQGGTLSLTECMSISSRELGAVLAKEEGSLFSIVDGVVLLAGIPVDKDNVIENAAPSRIAMKKAMEPSQMAALLRRLDDDAESDGIAEVEDKSSEVDELFSKQLLGEAEMRPFKSNLEYLAAGKEVVLAAIKICKTRGENKNTYRHGGDDRMDERSAKREAEVAYRKAEAKFRLRLQMTKKTSMPMPKLERLVVRLGLSTFERFTLILLVVNVLDRKVKMNVAEAFDSRYTWRDSTSVSVGEIIVALCDGNLEKEIAARSFFYKSSPLIASGIVDLQCRSYSQRGADIGDYICSLDRMVFDYVVGLDTELSEIMESAKCYSPDINMDSVILPPKMKTLAIERVENYEQFRKLRKEIGFDDIVRYGKGLNLFFHGKSGTGKTFFANALASKLGKKVLLVDSDALRGTKDTTEAQNLRIIFREAQVQNAIVFMDECDSLLGSREKGASRVAAILHEMESFDGVVILATNKPQCLDEAMHRRIALSLEFPEPDASMRLDIWRRHIPKAMTLHKEVSLESLAIEFELTGGFIKNAIFEALANAVTRVQNERRTKEREGKAHPAGTERKDLTVADVQLTMEDLRTACQLQSRADLSRTNLQRRIIPVAGLDTLVASDEALKCLKEIVEVERVRRVLGTRWGFKKRQGRSNCVLVTGPQGCGKTHAAGCLGFETGRPLQTLSMSELQQQKQTPYEISKVFTEAAVAGAVVVIEEGERLMLEAAHPENTASVGMELLYNIKAYNGLVVICVTTTNVPSEAGWMSSTPTPNRIAVLLSYLVKLKKPNSEERLQLWRQLIPSDTPRADDVEETLKVISHKYDTTGSRILSCIKRAAAAAAMRGNTPLAVEKSQDKCVLTGKDLLDSCQAEFDLFNDINTTAEWVRALYA